MHSLAGKTAMDGLVPLVGDMPGVLSGESWIKFDSNASAPLAQSWMVLGAHMAPDPTYKAGEAFHEVISTPDLVDTAYALYRPVGIRSVDDREPFREDIDEERLLATVAAGKENPLWIPSIVDAMPKFQPPAPFPWDAHENFIRSVSPWRCFGVGEESRHVARRALGRRAFLTEYGVVTSDYRGVRPQLFSGLVMRQIQASVTSFNRVTSRGPVAQELVRRALHARATLNTPLEMFKPVQFRIPLAQGQKEKPSWGRHFEPALRHMAGFRCVGLDILEGNHPFNKITEMNPGTPTGIYGPFNARDFDRKAPYDRLWVVADYLEEGLRRRVHRMSAEERGVNIPFAPYEAPEPELRGDYRVIDRDLGFQIFVIVGRLGSDGLLELDAYQAMSGHILEIMRKSGPAHVELLSKRGGDLWRRIERDVEHLAKTKTYFYGLSQADADETDHAEIYLAPHLAHRRGEIEHLKAHHAEIHLGMLAAAMQEGTRFSTEAFVPPADESTWDELKTLWESYAKGHLAIRPDTMSEALNLYLERTEKFGRRLPEGGPKVNLKDHSTFLVRRADGVFELHPVILRAWQETPAELRSLKVPAFRRAKAFELFSEVVSLNLRLTKDHLRAAFKEAMLLVPDVRKDLWLLAPILAPFQTAFFTLGLAWVPLAAMTSDFPKAVKGGVNYFSPVRHLDGIWTWFKFNTVGYLTIPFRNYMEGVKPDPVIQEGGVIFVFMWVVVLIFAVAAIFARP